MASAMKVIEIYYARPIITDREDAVDQTERLHGDVEFKDVTFKFGKHIVLDNVNFKIKAGQTVAIMGETGSGKTSLINLIPRFYDELIAKKGYYYEVFKLQNDGFGKEAV